MTEIILIFQTITKITLVFLSRNKCFFFSYKSVYRMTSTADSKPSNLIDNRYKLFIIHSSFPFRKSRKNLLHLCHTTDMTRRGLEGKKVQVWKSTSIKIFISTDFIVMWSLILNSEGQCCVHDMLQSTSELDIIDYKAKCQQICCQVDSEFSRIIKWVLY